MQQALFQKIVLVVLAFLLGLGVFYARNTAIENRLSVLEDREAIRTLLLSYGRYVDERDWEAFSELFVENGGRWNGGMGVSEGREAIIQMMEETIGSDNNATAGGGLVNLHLLSNEFIHVDGEHATALSKWVFVMTAQEGGPEVVYVGHYQDELSKVEGEWKFKQRTVFGDIMQSLALQGLQEN